MYHFTVVIIYQLISNGINLLSDRIDYEIDDQTNDSLGKLQPGNYANLVLKYKNINCPLLFESKVHDLPAPSFMKKPFQYIPGILKVDYTYDNRVKIYPWYISENFPTNHNGA